MYQLTNIPKHGDPNTEVRSVVKGETIDLVAVDRRDLSDDAPTLGMGSLMIGDHMFTEQFGGAAAVREMVGRALVTVISAARTAGYRQAQADIRKALGA